MIKFISGIVFTLSILYIICINTTIAFTCDVTKYTPMWETLDQTLLDLLGRNSSGLHCMYGMYVKKAPNPGQIDNELLNDIREEYWKIPNKLHKYYRESNE